jgi:hypothetical protein
MFSNRFTRSTLIFERLIHSLENLQTVPYFPHLKLTAWQNILGRIQAETNLSLIEPI